MLLPTHLCVNSCEFLWRFGGVLLFQKFELLHLGLTPTHPHTQTHSPHPNPPHSATYRLCLVGHSALLWIMLYWCCKESQPIHFRIWIKRCWFSISTVDSECVFSFISIGVMSPGLNSILMFYVGGGEVDLLKEWVDLGRFMLNFRSCAKCWFTDVLSC